MQKEPLLGQERAAHEDDKLVPIIGTALEAQAP
jgi:hypothetical protein